jgi:peptide/nickel transport system substrate-binding protein
MSEINMLEKLFTQGKISRREFLTKTTALGVASALPAALLSKPVRAATPKKGGRIRFGLSNASIDDDLNTGISCCSTWELFILFQVRNCLVEMDPKGNPIPELAESWESTPNAAKWVFKIRKGVEFHNGKTLDAHDVVFSINHHRAAESKSPVKSLLAPIKEVKADDKHTVVFELTDGYADMPALLTDYHLVIVPEGYTTWNDGLGTGGYIMKEIEPGVRVLSVRNPNYWKAGRAHFDEIEGIAIHDVNARTAALRTGKIDVMDSPDLKTVHLLKKIKDLQVVNVTGLRHYTIPMRTDMAPFDNNDVRLALKYIVDREELAKKILNGYGTIGNDHPIAPSMRYYASELPQRTYDRDKARFHIKKAGLEGHTFKLHAADTAFTGCVDTATLIRESAAKAGIKIEVVREPNDGYWTNVWRTKPWCFSYWSGRATQDMIFSTAYSEDASWNDAHWKHPRFNQLLKLARAELDDAKRRRMYVEMQKIVRDEGGTIVPMFADNVMVANTRLRFEEPMAGHYEMDGWRCSEKWWFA